MAKKKVYTLNRNGLNIPRSGGGGGYEPDGTTIGFTSDDKLKVLDYVTKTYVDQFVELANETFEDVYDRLQEQRVRVSETAVSGAPTIFSMRMDGIDYNFPTGSEPVNVYGANLAYSADNKETIEVYLQRLYCPESFAVELDERLEAVEEDLTEINPIVARALLTPVATPTAPELVGVGTDKEQKRVHIGPGLGYDSNTDTVYATGGGGGGNPLFIHCVEFIFDNEGKCGVRFIDDNPNTVTKEQFFSHTRRIVSLYGTTNNMPDPTSFQFMGSMGSNGIIFTTGYKEGQITALEITAYESDSFVDWGVEPLNTQAINMLKAMKSKKKAKKTKIGGKLGR